MLVMPVLLLLLLLFSAEVLAMAFIFLSISCQTRCCTPHGVTVTPNESNIRKASSSGTEKYHEPSSLATFPTKFMVCDV